MAAQWETTTCHGCGGPKPRGMGRGIPLCPSCLQARERGELDVTRCRCGGPKPQGRGRKLCDDCREQSRRPAIVPCRDCGGTENKSKRKVYCEDCLALHEWRTKRRKVEKKRQPCTRCGGPKGAGMSRRLCDKCQRESKKVLLCSGCGVTELDDPLQRRCDACKRDAIERRRKRHREYQAKRRAAGLVTPRTPTAKQRQQDGEARRIRTRLKRERQGVALDNIRKLPVLEKPPPLEFQRLPVKPLADAINRAAARRRMSFNNPFAVSAYRQGSDDYALRAVCDECRITDRTLRRWMSGEIQTANFDTVDGVLVGLCLNWWDVYDGEHHASAEAVFEGDGRLVAA
jgi:hypothetical protein